MKKLIVELLLYLIIFFIVFFFNYLSIRKNIKKKKEKNISGFYYLCEKFSLNKNKLNKKRVGFWIAGINAFIISFVAFVISNIPVPIIFQFLIGFILLLALIYGLYEIYGRHLKKSENKNTRKEERKWILKK